MASSRTGLLVYGLYLFSPNSLELLECFPEHVEVDVCVLGLEDQRGAQPDGRLAAAAAEDSW